MKIVKVVERVKKPLVFQKTKNPLFFTLSTSYTTFMSQTKKIALGFVTLGAIALLLMPTAAAQVASDPEKLLADRFGFTAAEITQARSGKAVAKLLTSQDSADIGVLGAVRVDGAPARLAGWLRDVGNFRKAAELGLARQISTSPKIGDFADLALDSDELAMLRDCAPGNCDMRLGDSAIKQFQAIDWKAADAGRRANLVARQLLLGHAEAYLKGGDAALGAYHNESKPRAAADEFRLVLAQAATLKQLAAPLTAYLTGFPAAALPQSESLLYWAKGGAGPDAAISLHQLVIWRASGGEVMVVDKQLFSSRYIEAGLTVISMAPTVDGKGFYVLAGVRARSSQLSGMGARMLRGRVEKVARDTASMYLNWIRSSLSSAADGIW